MSVDELAALMAQRLPHVPREDLARLAEAVGEMCAEARAEEREACAEIAEAPCPITREDAGKTANDIIAARIRARSSGCAFATQNAPPSRSTA